MQSGYIIEYNQIKYDEFRNHSYGIVWLQRDPVRNRTERPTPFLQCRLFTIIRV